MAWIECNQCANWLQSLLLLHRRECGVWTNYVLFVKYFAVSSGSERIKYVRRTQYSALNTPKYCLYAIYTDEIRFLWFHFIRKPNWSPYHEVVSKKASNLPRYSTFKRSRGVAPFGELTFFIMLEQVKGIVRRKLRWVKCGINR